MCVLGTYSGADERGLLCTKEWRVRVADFITFF